MDASLPPELQSLLSRFDEQPEDIQVMWRYGLFLLTIDEGKARIVETHQTGNELEIVYETLAGERFSMQRPPMYEETEQSLLELVRKIRAEESPPH